MIEVGTTALGRREFLGIVWDNGAFPVAHAGQVLYNSVDSVWNAHNTTVANIPANNVITLPGAAGLGADTRGVAYIAATAGGNPYLIGFMHNMYNLGNKSSAFTNLGTSADAARKAIGGVYAGAEVIIGGDFNIEPRTTKRPRGAQLTLTARAARVGGPGTAYMNTTAVHSYDFWVVSNGAVTDADCSVYIETRVPPAPGPMAPAPRPCSDHSGILLQR